MFLQTVLYCWIYQLLYETSFQIINIYSITGQNQASVLLAIQDIVWHRCGFWTILIICSNTKQTYVLRESLNCDGNQFHQYQQNEQSPFISWTHRTPKDYNIHRVLLAIQDIVWHRCGFWTILIICSSTYNQGPSPCARAIALTRLTLHSSQLIPTQN
jgi:hypothetical protein